MTPPVRYDVRQAAALVGKSPSWMYQQGAAGNIPRSKLGHHVFWTEAQIAQIIASAAQEPKQPKPREAQKSQQRREQAPPKREQRRKPTLAPTNSKIPTADFSVSRLYRTEDAA
ncbi:helix-turn-helix transcriptional regulator [Nonomuraea sp. NPDC049655]|uniref:helix-turn-helix transcriptional regulator n=1 Tax=Nonomuraea sp. NPDC049655 TaxID=3364355 RepID=UPI0037A672F6